MPPLNHQQMILNARQRFDSASRTTLQTRTGPTFGSRPAPNPADMIEPICRAVCAGHDRWRLQARFEHVTINGPNATGGRIAGPRLDPLIRGALRAERGGRAAEKHGGAVAAALDDAWSRFTASARVPGLPWYPSFAAVPAPQAPPTPNVPTPLGACTFDRSTLDPARLTERMKRELGTPDPSGGPLFDALARAFATAIDLWLPAQMVTNVIGHGPAPSVAPPYVPIGPVIMGSVQPSGPHFST